MRRIVQSTGSWGFIVFFIFAGFVFTYAYADLFNLGDEYLIGQVMAFNLIFGPVIGLLFGISLAFFLTGISGLTNKKAWPQFKREKFSMTGCFIFLFVLLFLISFFPFMPAKAGLRWTAILLLLGGFVTSTFQEKIWSLPGLSVIQSGWSNVASVLSWCFSFLKTGDVAYAQVFRASGWATLNFVVIATLMVVELRYFEGGIFSSEFSPSEAGISSALVWSLKIAGLFFLFWFLHAVIRIVEGGFKFNFAKSALIGISSALLSGIITILVCGSFYTMALKP